MRYSILFLMLVGSTAHGALHGRLPLTPGGSDYQAYYDDVLEITWVADGNLVATHAFGVTDIFWSGSFPRWGVMTWATQQQWIAAMNVATYLGRSDWRLAAAYDLDGPDPDGLGNDGCNFSYGGTDCGFNVHPAAGELTHLYHYTLGNIGAYDTNGVHDDCDTGMPAPPACLTNVLPFTNFMPDHYWTSLECPLSVCGIDGLAVEFNARIGLVGLQNKTRANFAWPVRDGDIGAVPDSDGDGITDDIDNCRTVPNNTGAGAQCDSDNDGYGNRCDADFNQSGTTNAQDYILFRQQLGQPSSPPTYNIGDLNCSGAVNSQDYILFRGLLGSAPGPGAAFVSPVLP